MGKKQDVERRSSSVYIWYVGTLRSECAEMPSDDFPSCPWIEPTASYMLNTALLLKYICPQLLESLHSVVMELPVNARLCHLRL